MADDNSARFRSSDSFGRGQAPGAPANDPLAELARLIGRNDAFADYGRPPPPAPEAGDPLPSFLSHPAPQYGVDQSPPAFLNEPAQHYEPEPAPPHNEPAPYSEPPSYSEPGAYSEPVPRYNEPAPQSYSAPAPQSYSGHDIASRYNSDFPAHNDWPGQPAPGASYPPQHYGTPGAQHYDNQGYADPHDPALSHADPRPDQGFAPARAGFDAAGRPVALGRQGYGAPLYSREPDTGAMPPPHDDEFYDDEPRGGRRRGLLTVVAVLALAVVGTAGAFGYRSLFGGPGSSGPPPVIRASGEPSKVAPPPVTADASTGKFSYDRFSDAGKDEQVVPREEKPVDLAKAAAAAASAAPPQRAATNANPPSAIGEPRRVRTVPIRPDQSDVAPAVPQMQAGAPMSVAPPRQANVAANAPQPDEPRAAPPSRPSPRVALRSPPTPTQPAPVANAPLSLSPDANNAPPAAQASVPPPPTQRAAPPPTRVASAPASGGGSYLVQVSSQRSESDAESAYRGIQSKYSGVLGSHPHTVRRADLGSKGVYYRAMVGPFGTREAAVQLCASLKQAGGDCVVQH